MDEDLSYTTCTVLSIRVYDTSLLSCSVFLWRDDDMNSLVFNVKCSLFIVQCSVFIVHCSVFTFFMLVLPIPGMKMHRCAISHHRVREGEVKIYKI